MPVLRVMIGAAGSGKSTFLLNNPRQQEVVLSPDQYLVEHYNYQWSPDRAAEAWAAEYQRFGRLILEQRALAFDAMFLSRIERSALVHIAKGAGYEVWAVCLNTSLELCLERNQRRDREPVPDERIRQMHKRLRLPTDEEGFDRIIHVNS